MRESVCAVEKACESAREGVRERECERGSAREGVRGCESWSGSEKERGSMSLTHAPVFYFVISFYSEQFEL